MSEITNATTVSPGELAVVLGVTARSVRMLAEDGVLRKHDGRYNLASSVQAYINFKKRESTDETRKAESIKAKAEAQIKAAKAQIVKMEADELSGKMHRAEDVETLMNDMVYEVRSALMALPGRLAVDVSEAASAAEASTIIAREVHKVMKELSQYDYDPAKYEERVRERMKWELEREEDGNA